MMQSLWKIVRQIIKWLNIELPYDSANPLLGVYPREVKIILTQTLVQNVYEQ